MGFWNWIVFSFLTVAVLGFFAVRLMAHEEPLDDGEDLKEDFVQPPELPEVLSVPILFLDFDGVLHPRDRGSMELLPALETVLREVPDIKIVISSNWRLSYSLDNLRAFFSEDIAPRIIGVTDDLSRDGLSRYDEIVKFCREHEVHYWLAIDDCQEEYPPDCPYLVCTERTIGLNAGALRLLKYKLSYL